MKKLIIIFVLISGCAAHKPAPVHHTGNRFWMQTVTDYQKADEAARLKNK